MLEVHAVWPRTQPAVGARAVGQMRGLLPVVVAAVAAVAECRRLLGWWAQ